MLYYVFYFLSICPSSHIIRVSPYKVTKSLQDSDLKWTESIHFSDHCKSCMSPSNNAIQPEFHPLAQTCNIILWIQPEFHPLAQTCNMNTARVPLPPPLVSNMHYTIMNTTWVPPLVTSSQKTMYEYCLRVPPLVSHAKCYCMSMDMQ